MPPSLAGVDLKIGRAESHLADLKEAIGAVLKPDAYSFTMEFDQKAQKHALIVHGLPAIPPEWTLATGETLYNLRSALDHLAWQLVMLDGGTPGEHTQFPIRETPFDKNGDLLRARIQPTISSAQILDLLEEVQPYRGPMGEPADPTRSPLLRLHKLNNVDKHRLLLVIAGVLDLGEMYWGWSSAYGPPPKFATSGTLLEEGSPVARFDFHGNEPPPEFDPHPALNVALSEADTPEIAFIPLTDVLGSVLFWVKDHIVGMRFRLLFP
jgi:hypothetical protein